jgi:hypothetical protein
MMAPTFPDGQPGDREDACVFVDAGPFSYDRLTGLSRYTARLTLALARKVPIRFFSESQGTELHARCLVAEGLAEPQDGSSGGSGEQHRSLLHAQAA